MALEYLQEKSRSGIDNPLHKWCFQMKASNYQSSPIFWRHYFWNLPIFRWLLFYGGQIWFGECKPVITGAARFAAALAVAFDAARVRLGGVVVQAFSTRLVAGFARAVNEVLRSHLVLCTVCYAEPNFETVPNFETIGLKLFRFKKFFFRLNNSFKNCRCALNWGLKILCS